jgi:hypothetical protein
MRGTIDRGVFWLFLVDAALENLRSVTGLYRPYKLPDHHGPFRPSGHFSSGCTPWSEPALGRFVDRVNHLQSGQASHFATVEEFLAFLVPWPRCSQPCTPIHQRPRRPHVYGILPQALFLRRCERRPGGNRYD